MKHSTVYARTGWHFFFELPGLFKQKALVQLTTFLRSHVGKAPVPVKSRTLGTALFTPCCNGAKETTKRL